MHINTAEQSERVVLMGIFKTSVSDEDILYSMNELKNLAESALLLVCRTTIQRRDKVEAATYIGTGKVEELAEICREEEADALIINTELSGAQIKNLTDLIGVKIIDRTALILDIFAVRAKSHIAKMQVELAQYKYRMPRLKGFGEQMSRIGGGLGTRGPGEQKLELDRRKISEKIHDLEERLKVAEQKRHITKKSRIKSEVKTVAIVGYTNAGKSSLMNLFIERYPGGGENQPVFVKNMLFATLDTFHRRICLENDKEFVLSDTVGFVSDLPHDLVKAFASTLEEVPDADYIIHVVDSSNSEFRKQMDSTIDVLEKLGADKNKIITVYNKCDIALDDFEKPVDGIMISVLNGDGFEELTTVISKKLFGENIRLNLIIPYSKGSVVQRVMDTAFVLGISYEEDGTYMEVEVPMNKYDEYKNLGIIKDETDT